MEASNFVARYHSESDNEHHISLEASHNNKMPRTCAGRRHCFDKKPRLGGTEEFIGRTAGR